MKIEINDKYRIQSDSVQIMVIQKSVISKPGSKHKGEESTATLGYFRTVQQAFKFLLQQQILDSDATSFEELIEEVERIEKELKQAITI